MDLEPVWTRDFPDPFLIADSDGYHAYATSSGFIQVQRLDAATILEWAGPTEAFSERPQWAVALSIWAPSLLRVGDSYLLYYTAQVEGTERHCISVAEASAPEGPFIDTRTAPLLCPDELGGAIDPSPFVDRDGTTYLLWKNDGVTLRRESSIWAQPITPDGRELVGESVRLIDTDQSWEFPHVEAPSMLRSGSTYWLAYSGNWWNQAAYGIGLARCESPRGPCHKPFDAPILTSRQGAHGPGGAELFSDRHGRTLMAYHAWLDRPGYPGHRALRIAEIVLTEADAQVVQPPA